MAYIPGSLSIERVIRPNAVEELLRLQPSSGAAAIIFDLEASLKRTGLCDFIKECEAANAPLTLEANGSIAIPPSMEKRFEFFREFYGLTRWAVLGVEILQTGEKKADSKAEAKSSAGGSSEGSSGMKKLDEPPPAPAAKPKAKTFQKLEAVPLQTVPAGIVWIAGASKKAAGPKGKSPTGPGPLSNKLGGHRVGWSSVGLGKPSAGLKNLGGFGGPRG